LVLNYLEETYHSTTHRINVYVTPGPQAIALTRLPRERLKDERVPRIECTVRKSTRKSGRKLSSSKVIPKKLNGSGNESLFEQGKAVKRKRAVSDSDHGDGSDESARFGVNEEDDDFDIEVLTSHFPKMKGRVEEDLDGEDDDIWEFSMRSAPPPQKKPRKSDMNVKGKGRATTSEKNRIWEGDVLVLSSD
jgi:ATP-dependent DNA helicase Q1